MPRAGYRAIAVDLRGYGLSDKPGGHRPEYRREDFRDDLVALLDVLTLNHRSVLVGHSLGGGVALDAVMHYPDRFDRLVLINPVGFAFPRAVLLSHVVPRGLVDALGAHAVPRAVVEAILRHVAFGDASAITEEVIDQYWLPTQLPGFLGAAHATAAQFDWSAFPPGSLARVAVPTLLVIGRGDRIVHGGASAARLLPNAEVVELDGGHCVHEEQPDRVWQRVIDFLGSNS